MRAAARGAVGHAVDLLTSCKAGLPGVVLREGEHVRVELAAPRATTIQPGAYLEFVTGDWLVHEIIFELDSLLPDARAFLERTDQVASPPMLRLDSRFVVDFEGSPPGRYPFVVEGSGAPGHGVVVVEVKP